MSSETISSPKSVTTTVRENWGWLLALGILLIIGGIILIVAPLASSIAVTLLIAAVMLIGGIVQIYHAFRTQGWSGFLWNLITGIISVIGGVLVYANPLAGTLALTAVLAIIFIAQGISQLLFAFRVRQHTGWFWLAIAGVISIICGIMIWRELPSSAAWALGLLAGISIIMNGWSYVAIALSLRALVK